MNKITSFYEDNNKKFIDQILASASNENKSIEPFIRRFYSFFPGSEVAADQFNNLYQVASSTYQFIQNLNPDKVKIRVFNPSDSENGFNSENTILEILLKDIPFVVDSITKELERRSIKVHRVIHPIIFVKRNEQGDLIELYENKTEGANTESLLHFHIGYLATQEERNALVNSISMVLDKVKLSVRDWRPMLQKADEAIVTLEQIKGEDKDLNEIAAFLSWLKNDNFIFLSSYDYIEDPEQKPLKDLQPSNMLGIINASDHVLKQIVINDILDNARTIPANGVYIEISKINKISPVHRSANLDYILLKHIDKNTNKIHSYIYVGLFTSVIYYQSVTLTPLIRKKIQYVIEKSGFGERTHNGKDLLTIMESIPREEIFECTQDELFINVMEIFTLLIKPEVKIITRVSAETKLLHAMVFIPSDNFSYEKAEKICEVFRSRLGGRVYSQFKQLTDTQITYLYVSINNVKHQLSTDEVTELQSQINEITRLWSDDLYTQLLSEVGVQKADDLHNLYKDAFSVGYKEQFSPQEAMHDIWFLEKVTILDPTLFNLYTTKNFENSNIIELKIYTRGEAIIISDIMPMIENMGFITHNEFTYKVERSERDATLWVHYFRLKVKANIAEKRIQELKAQIEEACIMIFHKKISNDGFNKLILFAGLNWRQVLLMRSICKYLRQTGITYSQRFIEETFARYPQLTSKFVELFYLMFDPNIEGVRANLVTEHMSDIDSLMNEVKTIADDVVIRRYFDTLKAMWRTNFFQTDSEGNYKSYLSFKFDSSKVPELPLPRPYAEIFVYSTIVEAIHLRGGKVARGGLRWSDRTEDYRTEVLGLMKTQNSKNSIIVPVGSKGGFIVKNLTEGLARDEVMARGIESYKTFLRGMLDITDNIIDGKIIIPENVIRHDGDDPYLVVAADKGTATFSDIANSVSKEYGFWLDDAFASGGSAGYDHKKMAITAKGAWICAERHFSEIGRDISSQEFTAVGVGDMSGDVFGNGLLRSRKYKLVAAFNHMHIFIDPSPDTEKSYIERERLFNLPRSTWMDYDKSIMSEGAMIYSRNEKVLELTPQIKELLGLNQDKIKPDELVKAILTAKVDLLWNGGIGTYVKSEDEVNETVGDRANDAVRVNGKELKCLAVAEGGNLGFTQKGRIEYAQNGGMINTDAIDNSAGVDCSDHEVNIKIALRKAFEKKKFTEDERNNLLAQMTDEVGKLVLRDNYLQSLSISVSQHQGNSLLEMQSRLVNILEKENLLDRKIEYLPSNQEFVRRSLSKQSLTRPELAILLAYSKLSIYSKLIDSNLPDDPYFEKELMMYFPQQLREKYKDEILGHQLRREIIATVMTNAAINRIGSSYFSLTMEDTSLQASDITRGFTIVRDLFDLDDLWQEVEALDGKIDPNFQKTIFVESKKLVQRVISWFLRNNAHPLDIAAILQRYKKGVLEIMENHKKILSGQQLETFNNRLANYQKQDIPAELAKKMAMADLLSAAPDIVHIASECSLPVVETAIIFFAVQNRFQFDWMQIVMEKLTPENYWQRLSVKTLREDFYDKLRKLTTLIAMQSFNEPNPVEHWVLQNMKQVSRFDNFMKDLKSQETQDFSMMVIASKRIDSLFIS